MMVSFGSSTSGIAEPGAPFCLPGSRPEERRDERRSGLRYGESEDGGLFEVEESFPSRCLSSASSAACAAITSRRTAFAARSSTTSPASSSTEDSNGSDTSP